ncbi:MAG: serine hydrolase [Verrucomicrobia bacterium]|nr:serine hydrolase [Verrucomicrobiota bacterium]
MNRPVLRLCLFLAACASVLAADPAPKPPVTGAALPGLEAVDSAMLSLLAKHGSPGGQLAVTYRGRLVLSKGYGLADRETAAPVTPDSLSRIASLSKLVTALAILQLVEEKKLDLDARAFALIPHLTPARPGKPDPRLAEITVRQLLQHTGGWDRGVSGDPMFKPALIAEATRTPAPAGVEAIIRYMLTEPLDFAPGTRYAYSNFGYAVLGRIVETLSGRTYADYVRARIFAPLGITRAFLGRTAWDQRDPAELHYYDPPGAKTVRSVFPGTPGLVASPYGGFHLEAMDAHGQWVMRATDYVRLLAALDGTRPPALLSPASIALLTERPAPPVSVDAAAYYGLGTQVRPINGRSGTGANWWHGGSLSGTITHSVRLANGWSWVAFFNTRRPQGDTLAGDADKTINAALGTATPPARGDLFTAPIR